MDRYRAVSKRLSDTGNLAVTQESRLGAWRRLVGSRSMLGDWSGCVAVPSLPRRSAWSNGAGATRAATLHWPQGKGVKPAGLVVKGQHVEARLADAVGLWRRSGVREFGGCFGDEVEAVVLGEGGLA